MQNIEVPSFRYLSMFSPYTAYQIRGCDSEFIMESVTSNHVYFMRQAIKEAEKAAAINEIPVGAVIVHENRIVARAHNQKEMLKDPTAHAEMIAITQCAEYLQNWRLTGATIYVTLEPCAMCAGALVQSRIDRLVYGAVDKKAGACVSVMNLVQNPKLNHRLEVIPNILADECGDILKSFFLENCRMK